MSNGFWYRPNLPRKYFSTMINNTLQTAFEQELNRDLPVTLTRDDIPVILKIRNEYLQHALHGEKDCETLDQIVVLIIEFGSVEFGRSSSFD